MGKSNAIQLLNYIAEATVNAFRIVKFGSTDKYVSQAAANTDAAIGVYQGIIGGTVAAEKDIDIVRNGLAEVMYGGVVTRGDLLTADANGKAVELTDAMLEEGACFSIGIAEESGVSGDIGSVYIFPQKVSKFDEVDASAEELNYLDIAAPGTLEASKAIVVNAAKHVDELNTASLKLGASGSTTAVTSSAAELNILTGVTATAAELNLNDLSAQTETVTEAGAVSVVKKVTQLTETVGTYAATLAVPNAAMLGQVKVIAMTARASGSVTIALTNVIGGSEATTATFDAVDETLILVAGVNKWIVVKEMGVTLS